MQQAGTSGFGRHHWSSRAIEVGAGNEQRGRGRLEAAGGRYCTGPTARRSRGEADALKSEHGVGDRDERGEEVIEAGEKVDGEQRDGRPETGRRRVKKVQDPRLLSEEEVKEHSVSGHMSCRNWCHHCVGGRVRERDHRRKDELGPHGIPECHLDYCFPGNELDQRLTVLVAIEKYTKMKKAVVVPTKGSTGSHAARMVIEPVITEVLGLEFGGNVLGKHYVAGKCRNLVQDGDT